MKEQNNSLLHCNTSGSQWWNIFFKMDNMRVVFFPGCITCSHRPLLPRQSVFKPTVFFSGSEFKRTGVNTVANFILKRKCSWILFKKNLLPICLYPHKDDEWRLLCSVRNDPNLAGWKTSAMQRGQSWLGWLYRLLSWFLNFWFFPLS